ncbi:MAG TPA: glycosyltransferase family 4 protein, partial [Blastocatellia bacterium]|nr:glycosyltransferase family 4 protein [Blastocatellia bacterium]
RTGWYHTLSSQIDIDAKVERWKLKLMRWRKRLVFNAATHIVPASQAASKDVEQVFRIPHSKCRVFYNSLADPISIEADDVEYHSRTEQSPKLVCAGRLYPTKGQDVLIRAVALLKEKGLDARVEFLGCGPEEDNLKSLASSLGIKDQCQFLGALPPYEVLSHLKAATVSVVPSRIDNNPLVVIESLSLGIPVVASGVGGILESMTDGREGFLVAPDDHIALAEKLSALLTNPELHRTMSINARNRFLTQFEQKRIVTEQANWFESLVARA